MDKKEIWNHLCRELAKTKTLIITAEKILESPLFKRSRYQVFTASILDAYTRVIVMSIYHFFDVDRSWHLGVLPDLTEDERKQIVSLRSKAKDYITIRNGEIGHLSKKIKLQEFSRFKWLPANELEKTKDLMTVMGKFLNKYGSKRFNESTAFEYGEVGINLQCLIEDLEKILKSHEISL